MAWLDYCVADSLRCPAPAPARQHISKIDVHSMPWLLLVRVARQFGRLHSAPGSQDPSADMSSLSTAQLRTAQPDRGRASPVTPLRQPSPPSTTTFFFCHSASANQPNSSNRVHVRILALGLFILSRQEWQAAIHIPGLDPPASSHSHHAHRREVQTGYLAYPLFLEIVGEDAKELRRGVSSHGLKVRGCRRWRSGALGQTADRLEAHPTRALRMRDARKLHMRIADQRRVRHGVGSKQSSAWVASHLFVMDGLEHCS